MKNLSVYLSCALLLLGAACGKTQQGVIYNPGDDDAKAIHFIQSSIDKEFAQDVTTGTIRVEIARPGNKGSYTVCLQNKGDDAPLFTVPDEVTVPDGQYAVSVPVEVDLGGLIVGSSYKTTLYIRERDAAPGDDAAQVAQYTDKVNISASFELEWEPFYRTTGEGERIQQLATYHYNGFYTGRDSGLEVEKAVGANIFRLKDWASGVTFRFILNDDNTCTVPAQSIGYYHSNYNEYVHVADMAVYTGNEAAYSSYPCTFDGKDTFSFYLIYYVSGGYFNQGTETLVFDTDVDTTPVVEIEFQGIETTETGFRAPRLAFRPNDYAKFYKATVVAGDITANAILQEQVRQQLIDDRQTGTIPVVTRYEADASIWNVPKGGYTAVALAYDAEERPGKLYTQRFTCDPAGEYAVKVNTFEWYSSDRYPAYSPYTTLFWEMQTANVSTLRYLCMQSAYVEYICETLGVTLQELARTRGNQISDEAVAMFNSEEGFSTLFSGLAEGTSYTLGVLTTNEFGDETFVTKTASTFGHYATDFDRTKTMEDFLGAFKATATVEIGSESKSSSYRIDITRLNDHDVTIKGMSDMRDFAPELTGYYDDATHSIIIEPQPAGRYGGNYVTLGLSDGMSIYWGGNSLAIGYIGDRLYWAASPYATANTTMYQFLLFSSPQATSATYLRKSVGDKIYTAVSMAPLKLAPSTADTPAAARTVMLEVDGRRFESHLPDTTQWPAALPAEPAALRQTAAAVAGKRVRDDLVLHCR